MCEKKTVSSWGAVGCARRDLVVDRVSRGAKKEIEINPC
jgi:hypothetical protein